MLVRKVLMCVEERGGSLRWMAISKVPKSERSQPQSNQVKGPKSDRLLAAGNCSEQLVRILWHAKTN